MKLHHPFTYLAIIVSLMATPSPTFSQGTMSQKRIQMASDFAKESSAGDKEAYIKNFSAILGLNESLKGTSLPDLLLRKRHDFILWQEKPDDLIYSSPRFRTLYPKLVQQGAVGAKILGGRPAEANEFSNCVAIGNQDGYFCTGTLIGKRLVFTAGHCFPEQPSKILVGNSISGGGKEYRVKENGAFQHKNYHAGIDPHNDLTILVLETDVTDVVPAPIARTEDCDNMEFVRITGFGTTNLGGTMGFGTKRVADVVVVSPDGIKYNGKSYGADAGLEFVAEDLHADTCKGDSGGPAFLKNSSGTWSLAGATSRATKNATMPCGDGGIYVRVDKYIPWVKEIAGLNGLSFP